MAAGERVPTTLRPALHRLLQLNAENADLIQAVLAGQALARRIATAPAGYGPAGERLYPVTEKKPVRY